MSNLHDLLLIFFFLMTALLVVGDHKFSNLVRSVCITLTFNYETHHLCLSSAGVPDDICHHAQLKQ